MTGGAPLARGGTPAAGTDDTRGGDMPTTGMEPIGTGATAVSGGMLAIPPIPMKGKSQQNSHGTTFQHSTIINPGMHGEENPLPVVIYSHLKSEFRLILLKSIKHCQ